MTSDDFIYGKDRTEGIVSIEVDGDSAKVFTEINGQLTYKKVPNEYWLVTHGNPGLGEVFLLKGQAYYDHAIKCGSRKERGAIVGKLKARGIDHHVVYNDAEMFMMKNGYTYYKGMKPEDVSVLSFDIETTSLSPVSGQVLLISNTFRRNGKTERKVFAYDEFNSQKEMIYAWCNWVCDKNPSILLGHNIFNFDLPYLRHHAGSLQLGRDLSEAHFATHVSNFRKDGSQSYDYKNVRVYGREIIDTFHLAIKYDLGRKYDSYGLKQIIKQEGLERADRQHFDASKIRDLYKDPEEWQKIKTYAEHDADDALALFDLMAPSFFYYTQSLPKTFQQVINSATGSQVDSFMKRAYIQQGYGLPKSSQFAEYEGAISFGKPGLYRYVNKIDVASLYPSIILQEKIYDKTKDPKGLFLEMVSYFTTQRLYNKKLAKETGDRYYKDLSDSQKIFINSAYGFMGAPGLLFNAPANAAKVTRTGREILTEGIKWAEEKGFTVVNADTDSFSYTTGKQLSGESFAKHIEEINKLREGIIWEDDGQYKKVLIVKTKNYVLDDGKNRVVKGSSLKATMKEPALRRFINEIIDLLMADRKDMVYDAYINCCNSINFISNENIHDWCSKKTITKAVLYPERTNEARIKEAIEGKHVKEGDKIYVFFQRPEKITLLENYSGEIDNHTLYKKVYKTLEIFSTVMDIGVFPNFSLKRNLKRIENAASGKRKLKALGS